MENNYNIKAARESISNNKDKLSTALQSSQTTFQRVVEKCAEWKIISQTEWMSRSNESTYLLDYYTGPQSLARKAVLLVDLLIESERPNGNALDDILCILHETGCPVVQEAAETIASDYPFDLPKYNSLSSCPASPSRKAKWYSRVLKFVCALVFTVAIMYVIVGFSSIWLPKIALRLLAYGLTLVAFIAVTVGLIIAYKIGYDITKGQAFIVGIMFGLFEPVILDIWKNL